MVYIAPVAGPKSGPQKPGARAAKVSSSKTQNGRSVQPNVSKQLSSSQTAESQAAEAKRLLARERKALQEAKHALSNNDAPPSDHAKYTSQQPVRPSQGLILQAEHKDIGHRRSNSPEQPQASPKQSPPPVKQSKSAQCQPDQLGSYGLPLQASASRPTYRFEDATDLASPPPSCAVSAQDQTGAAQPQFMSGLMGLHGVTTPEEKQRREDKQKQYARELDEQVSQKQAARTAEQGRSHVVRSSQPFQSKASPLQPVQQQQQQQQQPQWARSGDAKQYGGANEYRQLTQHMQQPPTAQHTQHAWPQRDDNSMMASSQVVADGQAPPADGKGLKAAGGEGGAAVLASDVPAAYQGRQAQQEGRRGFMSGVAELKAGPTQEQQNHARLLRERLLADLQEQTEQRRTAEASRKAVEAAAEAKQEADIAAYHAQLRDKEAYKQQHSLGRDDQPAATGAVRASPPESLTSSWNGPEAPGHFSHHGPSVVPREPPHQDGLPDQASQHIMQHSRRQGRSLGSKSPSPAHCQEMPQPRTADAGNSNNSRPDSAAYKAKVGGVLAELQAEQARLRQLCSEQAAAMQSLQRQAQQAAKAHGMPADHTESDFHHKAGSLKSTGRPGQVPSRHWEPSAADVGNDRTRSAADKEEEQEEDSLDAFVVETCLVPVSLSQIPDQLPDHDLVDSHADDALTQHQTHYFGPQTGPKQRGSAIKQHQSQRKAMQQQQQQIQRGKHLQQEVEQSHATVHEKKLSRQHAGRQDASPKRISVSRPKIWLR